MPWHPHISQRGEPPPPAVLVGSSRLLLLPRPRPSAPSTFSFGVESPSTTSRTSVKVNNRTQRSRCGSMTASLVSSGVVCTGEPGTKESLHPISSDIDDCTCVVENIIMILDITHHSSRYKEGRRQVVRSSIIVLVGINVHVFAMPHLSCSENRTPHPWRQNSIEGG